MVRLKRNYSLLISKVLITASFTCFIWYQIRTTDSPGDDYNDNLSGKPIQKATLNASEEVVEVRTLGPEPSSYVRSYVAELNRMQYIHNEDAYGPLMEHDVVIVVQVHNRWGYLHGLINSLRDVPQINRTLLIFSHDLYDNKGLIEEIPNIVTFCKMMQIFYPYSIQLEPNRFPGEDPLDCPRNVNKEKAQKMGCQNAAYPDSFGHYREAKFCQTKHHWWWKINRVMDALNITTHHNGPFMFLEEDHYVVPDVIHVLRKMETARPKTCPDCRLFVMGTYLRTFNFKSLASGVDIVKWASSRHNMGMVIYRELWKEMKERCAPTFCNYDDYNWDWSLYKVSMACMNSPVKAMVVRATRVFHVGECGVHHKGKNCDTSRLTLIAQRVIQASVSYLYPTQVKVQKGLQRPLKGQRANGGWSDVRDHTLCMHFLNETLV